MSEFARPSAAQQARSASREAAWERAWLSAAGTRMELWFQGLEQGFKDWCNSRLRFGAIRWVFPFQVSSEVCSGSCPPYMLCVSCSLDAVMLAG